MILFFDKNFGTSVPKALRALKPPFGIEVFQDHFDLDTEDDKWLPVVGQNNWTVIGHDKFDKNESEIYAIQTYKVGGFYLWGAEETRWEKLRLLFRALDKIIQLDASTQRPFIFAVKKNGHPKRVKLSEHLNG